MDLCNPLVVKAEELCSSCGWMTGQFGGMSVVSPTKIARARVGPGPKYATIMG